MKSPLIYFCSKFAKWIPSLFVLFTVLLILLTLTPGDLIVNKIPNGSDKLSHATFFYIWTMLFWMAVKINNYTTNLPMWLIFITASLLGLTIEILQYLLPVDRGLELYDILANTVGICFGLICIWYMKHKKVVEQIIMHG